MNLPSLLGLRAVTMAPARPWGLRGQL